MRFRDSDSLLAMSVILEGEDPDVFVVFENGLAKRSPASEWTVKGRGILGVAVAKFSEQGGDLVGRPDRRRGRRGAGRHGEGHVVVCSRADEVRPAGRNTQGMQFATPGKDDSIVAVARNPERVVEARNSTVPMGTPRPSMPYRRRRLICRSRP